MALNDDEEAEYLALLEADDIPTFAATHLRIKTKAGKIETLHLNRAQQHVHERLEAQLAETGKVRALILKARQQGFSTYVGARFYTHSSTVPGVQVFILTHHQDATNSLFAMVDRFHKRNTSPLRPKTGAANAKELAFPDLDGGYEVGTAGTVATGRSKTIQRFHGSEVAFWKNADSHFAGAVQTVPDMPGTEIILESTANGIEGEFHERWQQAEAGIGDYIAIFVPWFWTEEYRRPVPEGFEPTEEEQEEADLHGLDLEQIVWRRAKIAELKSLVKFRQEYPATAAEAFQAADHDSYIKPDDVMRARKATLEGAGPLVIGVDPKREGNDRFSIAWRHGRKVEKVESDPDPTDTLRSAGKLKRILDDDKPARMFIDVGGNGGAIYDVLIGWDESYRDIVRLVNFGSSPIEPPKLDEKGKPMAGPANRRAEMWEKSNDWLKDEGGADIPDLDSLQSDACGPGYRQDTNQRLLIESKESMKRRKVRSPDEWDAVVLTFAEPVSETDTAAEVANKLYGGRGGKFRY